MDKIAMYGGAFDPVHNGHVHVMKAFMDCLRLERLLLIPTARSPHKAGERGASEEDRLAMCRLAAEGLPRVEVSDMEIRRGGKSYTVDTLYALKEAYPGARLYLLMGADMFFTLEKWHRYREILKLATLCPVVRAGETPESFQRAAEKMGAVIQLEEISPFPASSTEIRERSKNGESIEGLVPPLVEQYIQKHRLYGPAQRGSAVGHAQ